MKTKNKYAVIFIIAVCANVVNTGRLYYLKDIINDVLDDMQNTLSDTKERSLDDEEIGLQSSKGKKRLKIMFMPEKHSPEFIEKLLKVVRNYYNSKKVRVKTVCDRHFGSIYGAKDQRLNCLNNRNKPEFIHETFSESFPTYDDSSVSSIENDILKFIDQTRSEVPNELTHIRRKVKEYINKHHLNRQLRKVLRNYFIVPFRTGKASDFWAPRTKYKKPHKSVRIAMDYYDDSSSGRKFYKGRNKKELDQVTGTPLYRDDSALEDLIEGNVDYDDESLENDNDEVDEEMPDVNDQRPRPSQSRHFKPQNFNGNARLVRTTVMPKGNKAFTNTEETDVSDNDYSKEDMEDYNESTQKNDNLQSKTTKYSSEESKISNEQSEDDNKIPYKPKRDSMHSPTNRFEIVDNVIAPKKNKILTHGDSSEDIMSTEENEEIVRQKTKLKNIKDPSEKDYIYIQGPHHLQETYERDNVRKSSNQRLEHFLPKKLFWDEDEFNKLGYFWFNGPQGKFASRWRAPYR